MDLVYGFNHILLKYEDMPHSKLEMNFELSSFKQLLYISITEFPELELLGFFLVHGLKMKQIMPV